MTRTPSSKLKAHLGKYLRAVRAGREIVVTDRDVPVAKLVPYRVDAPRAIQVDRPRDPSAPPLGALKIRPVRISGADSTATLLEDRRRR